MERYWKPICKKREGAHPRSGTLHLAHVVSNRGRRGRKKDFLDAERLVKRLVARALNLSFVPDAEQRLWRTVVRRKCQLTRNRVRLQNRVESLLEEAHIKLSSFVSDLLALSALRMLKALADGETNPAMLAALADRKLHATQEQLRDALGACTELNPVYRRLLNMMLEELRLIDERSVNSTKKWQIYSVDIRTRLKGWLKYLVWASIQHNRSLPKWVPLQQPFLRPSSFLRGLVHVLARRRARGSTTATDPQRAIATCGASSIRLPTQQSRLKELSLRLSIVVWCRASDTNKLSE